jgi:flagellar biosynthesis chaperone FliJ
MKKFEFRLDAALRWRNTQLQLERAKLQKLLGEEQRLKGNLQSLLNEKQTALSELQAAGHLHSSDLRNVSVYLVGADARACLLREEITKCAKPIQQQRQRLLEAERNVRLLEELRDKRYGEWKHAFDQEIDGVAEESWLAANFRTSLQEV